jgi:hypothetical protein
MSSNFKSDSSLKRVFSYFSQFCFHYPSCRWRTVGHEEDAVSFFETLCNIMSTHGIIIDVMNSKRLLVALNKQNFCGSSLLAQKGMSRTYMCVLGVWRKWYSCWCPCKLFLERRALCVCCPDRVGKSLLFCALWLAILGLLACWENDRQRGLLCQGGQVSWSLFLVLWWLMYCKRGYPWLSLSIQWICFLGGKLWGTGSQSVIRVWFFVSSNFVFADNLFLASISLQGIGLFGCLGQAVAWIASNPAAAQRWRLSIPGKSTERAIMLSMYAMDSPRFLACMWRD